MTLGNAAAAYVRLIVWCLPFTEPHGFAGCLECRHQVEPATASLRAAEGGTSAGPAEMAERYGPETPVHDWRERLVCSRWETPRWRKKDSNPRSPVRDYALRDAPLIIPAIRSRGKNRFLCDRERRLKIPPRGRVGLSSEFRGCRRGKDLPQNAAWGWRPRRIPILGQNGHAAAAPSC